MGFKNETGGLLDGFMIQFNNNALGVMPASQHVPIQIPPGAHHEQAVPLNRNEAMVSQAAGRVLQVSSRLEYQEEGSYPHPSNRFHG